MPDASTAVLRRPFAAAPVVELPHRTAHVLVAPTDGFGDFSLLLARIRPGRLLMHRHPGEAIFIASGEGRFWLEGLSYLLAPGVAGFTPADLWHSFENTAEHELVILGCVCPGVVVGRYEEAEPIFVPSGRIASVAHLTRRVFVEHVLEQPAVMPLVDDAALSPFVSTRLLRIPARGRIERSAPALTAWVVVAGTGRVGGPLQGDLNRWDHLLSPKGGSVRLEASGQGPLAVVEVGITLSAVRA